MNIRDLLSINAKLPMPRQRIVANYDTIEYTVNLGCRAELDKDYKKTNPHYFTIDGKKIYVGRESTQLAETKRYNKNNLFIGAGFLPQPQDNHIGTPFSETLWSTEYPSDTVEVINRKGWCCTMSGNEPHRNIICDVIQRKHLTQLKEQNNYWFCYDEYKKQDGLRKFMFREPWQPHFDKKYITKNSFYHGYPAYQLGPWHYESIVELVPETTAEYFEITEKTVKPISARMPFVSVASFNFLHGLRKMGFRTFSPYIDETYDNEKNTALRVEMAVDAMFCFINSPINLQEIQKICDHNYKILGKIRKKNYFSYVAKKVKRLISF